VLGEFFAARESEVDDELLEAPYVRLQTMEAKGLSEVTLATLGEILGLGSYDDLVAGSRRRVLPTTMTSVSIGSRSRDDGRELWYWWSL
jgi:hypothetical protein